MGDKDHRLAQPLLQGTEFALQFDPSDGVERTERLVHQEKWGIGGEGARDPDTLPLPARQFARMPRRQLRLKAHEVKQFRDPLPNAIGRPSFDLRDHPDIAGHGEMREQAHFLDDIADHAAQAIPSHWSRERPST